MADTTMAPSAGEGPDAGGQPPSGGVPAPPQQEPEKKTKRPRRRALKFVVEHWVELLAALLGLATALLVPTTVVVTGDRDDLETTAADLEDRNDSLRDEIDDLEQENEDLRDQIDDMETTTTTARSSVADVSDESGSDPSVDSGTPPGETPGVYRQTSGTPVRINSGDGIDLDSLEPDWGVRGDGYPDLLFDGTYVGGNQFALMDHQPTIQECEAQTQILSWVEPELTTTGRELCVLTDAERWAYVRIADVVPGETIAFDVLVWKLPTDL